ncbi:hypothetical protein [Bacillus swezeyi]|uniref:hypothetical protein n=1 Tax=Bacillus swezeyi TaxID=1925020 RepID=UPI001CC2473B|nr:hypothetical protein [Bacillus swezeyi]
MNDEIDTRTHRNYEGYWKRRDNMGLTEFFGHSDCDGDISPEMCKIVADELEAILLYVEELAKKEMSYGHILRDGGYIVSTKQNSLLLAAD